MSTTGEVGDIDVLEDISVQVLPHNIRPPPSVAYLVDSHIVMTILATTMMMREFLLRGWRSLY